MAVFMKLLLIIGVFISTGVSAQRVYNPPQFMQTLENCCIQNYISREGRCKIIYEYDSNTHTRQINYYDTAIGRLTERKIMQFNNGYLIREEWYTQWPRAAQCMTYTNDDDGQILSARLVAFDDYIFQDISNTQFADLARCSKDSSVFIYLYKYDTLNIFIERKCIFGEIYDGKR